jgi:protease YdgD
MRKSHPQNRLLGNSKLRVICTGWVCGSFLLSSLYGFAAGPGRVTSGDAERKVIEQVSPPWGSVGQVNVAGYRRRVECTGSLIAPNVVVTAAHCVIDPFDRKPFPVDEIHFLAGVRGSKWLGHSTAKCLHFPPDYQFGPQSFSKDLVLITLNTGFNDIVPSDLDRTDAADPDLALIHAAYPADRRYVLTAQFGCHVITHSQSFWVTDCDARPASSGGPVFIQRGDGLKLAAIMVASGPSGSVAVPIATSIDILAARNCPQS